MNLTQKYVLEKAEVIYKRTDYYRQDDEASIIWNDPAIAIEWPKEYLEKIILSNKDANLPSINNCPSISTIKNKLFNY